MRKAWSWAILALLVVACTAIVACDKSEQSSDPLSFLDPTSSTAPSAASNPVVSPNPTPAVASNNSPYVLYRIENNPFVVNNVGVCLSAGTRSFTVIIDDAGPTPFTVDYNMYQCGERLIGTGNQCQTNPENSCDGKSPDFMQERQGISIEGPTVFAAHTQGSFIVNVDGDVYDCGRAQPDIAFKGATFAGPVPEGVIFAGLIGYGHRCNQCGYIDAKLIKTAQSGHTVTFKVLFRGGGNAVLDFKDGTNKKIVYNEQSVSHTYVNPGTYEAELIVERDGVPCGSVATVVIEDKKCSDYSAPNITLTPHTTLTSTLQTVTSITASPVGGTFSPTLPQAYSRPAYGQPSETKTFTYTLPYSPADGLQCSTSDTVDVTVPPKERSCIDMNVDVTASVDGDDVVCSASWTGPGSGLIKLDSGPWSSVGNPGSKTYNNLSAGNHTCSLNVTSPSVTEGGLSCSDSASFTISCEAASWWNQSITWNSNDIKANVHVRGDGNYVLRLYATSSYSEYLNNDPDYTKDTDSENIECRGQGELRVDYRWKGHPSRYWWADLTRDGVRVWKSQAVDSD